MCQSLQATFLRLAAISPLCLALYSPAPGLLLSLSLSISHRTGTSAPLLSVSTPNPPLWLHSSPSTLLYSSTRKSGQLNPPPPPRRAVFQPPTRHALEKSGGTRKGAAARITAPYFRAGRGTTKNKRSNNTHEPSWTFLASLSLAHALAAAGATVAGGATGAAPCPAAGAPARALAPRSRPPVLAPLFALAHLRLLLAPICRGEGG